MNRIEFLKRLERLLSNLPLEEKKSAMAYYNDFFDDAINDDASNEYDVVKKLGSPEKIAGDIIRTFRMEQQPNSANPQYGQYVPKPANSGGRIAVLVILLILSSPIWLSILAGIFGVWVGVSAAIVSVIASFIGVGLGLLGVGAYLLFNAFAAGLVVLGSGLIIGAIALLITVPLLKLLIWTWKIFIKFVGYTFKLIFGINRKEVA